METVERGGEGRQISWQFCPLPFLMKLIFLPRPRVTRANGCFELGRPRCQGLQGSHTRDDARRDDVDDAK